MADLTQESSRSKAQQAAVEVFLGGLSASARTTSLYKEGHPTILQIAERVADLLQKTLGQETTLTIDIKAKRVVFEETELTETPELTALASALHTLGIGQVLFTNRLDKEGMYRFFKVLVAKPDEKTSLTDLQKAVQQTRIDGLQMTFILNFVVTGETEQLEETPGRLSEEQILAFIQAETLPDFLTLLLKQNDVLHGKEVEALSELLDGVLNRECAVEDMEAAMPWQRYDPRVRQRWDFFMDRIKRPPRQGRARPRWTRADLLSWASVKLRGDFEALRDHHSHEKRDALRWALRRVHALLDHPASDRQPKFALAAYTRLLGELARDGHIAPLLQEQERWKALAGDSRTAVRSPTLRKDIEEKIVCAPFAERLAAHINEVPKDDPEFVRIVEILVFLGPGMTPLLLAELARVQDKFHRAKLCSLLAAVGRQGGISPLLSALKEEDWFLIVNIVAILAEVESPACVPHLTPLLKHGHAKVREAAARVLVKFAGKEAVESVLEYVKEASPDETTKIIIALSLISHPGLDRGFIEICRKTAHRETRLAIITALGRFPTQLSLAFLKDQVRRTWYEIVTGRRKELVAAAKRSLELLRKEGHA